MPIPARRRPRCMAGRLVQDSNLRLPELRSAVHNGRSPPAAVPGTPAATAVICRGVTRRWFSRHGGDVADFADCAKAHVPLRPCRNVNGYVVAGLLPPARAAPCRGIPQEGRKPVRCRSPAPLRRCKSVATALRLLQPQAKSDRGHREENDGEKSQNRSVAR